MMAPQIALRTIKHAIRAGSWRPDPHLFKQMGKRGLILADVLAAIRNAKRIEPHDMRPLNAGGQSWRVFGEDADGRILGVGVELVPDRQGGFVVIMTAFALEATT